MSEARRWALVLGASSGFGEAAAKALAASGRSIFGVHLDRRSTMGHVAEVIAALEAAGAQAAFFNMNAADPDKRAEALDTMKERLGGEGTVDVLLHSLAFGTLRPYTGEEAVSEAQMDMTVRVMAHSLVDWVRGAIERGMMGQGGRIFAMTSSGSTRALPSYGPVSAAKAALESHVRQLAVELAPQGITANAIRAGVTATPAAQKIPGYDRLAEAAARRNPSGRLTTTDDVARTLVVLAHPDTHWMTGNVIGVDGGEDIVG